MKKAKIVSSEYITNVTVHRGTNFLNDYDEAEEKSDDDSLFNCNRPLRTNEIMKTSALRKCKYVLYLFN